jgi:hypothetical protein
MESDPQILSAIRDVLQRFQDGYTRRDPAGIDAFMQLFVDGADLEVIGTSASGADRGEWCLGPEMTRDLVVSDWEYWGDLRLDLDAARIRTRGDVAWLSAPGVVSQHFDTQESYAGYLDYVRALLDENGDPAHKLLRIQLGCANTLYELGRGEDFTWPIVLTAVLVRQADGWRFTQMRFGFPTTRYPDERIF